MRIVDSHCHLDDVEDVDAYIAQAEANGVVAILAVGASRGYESNFKARELSERFKNIYFSVGIHPHDCTEKLSFEPLNPLLDHPKAVAIGETGLDKHYYSDTREQILLFREHIEVAKTLNKPVIVHCRDAYDELPTVISQYPEVVFVLHCFTGDSHDVSRLLKFDNVIFSFSGILTFKKAEPVRFAAKKVPLDLLLVETDAPFLAPEPHRGKRCESWMVVETLKALSRLKNVDPGELAEITTSNFERIFGVTCGG